MKAMVVTVAAAGLAAAFAMPAKADGSARADCVNTAAQVEHTDISAQRRHYHRHRYHGHRYRYVPRYGYYRPYRPYGYYAPYYYRPGVSFGFWGGPRLGVWF
ncbi:MAG: hypothetical protein ACOY5F_08530 [Pseudomonadota bacterium]